MFVWNILDGSVRKLVYLVIDSVRSPKRLNMLVSRIEQHKTLTISSYVRQNTDTDLDIRRL